MIRLPNVFLALLVLTTGSATAAENAQLIAGVFSPARAAPDFSLRGSDGRELQLSSHSGKVVVLGFGFTSCPDVCPITLAVLAQAHKKLGVAAKDVQVVYITVDPERDDVARMKKYLGTFNPTFLGGTGTPEQLTVVRTEYGITATKKFYGADYTVGHSSYIYLIDRKGNLRALMPYGRAPEDYVHDLKMLLNE